MKYYRNTDNIPLRESVAKPSIQKHSASHSDLETRCINNFTDFEQIKNEWNILLDKSEVSHPFLSWEWQFTWWEEFSKSQDKLLIIIVSKGNNIIAIAPFYLKAGIFTNCLMMIGEGEEKEAHVASHYHDIICSVDNIELAISVIGKYLKAHKAWDYCRFTYVLNTSSLYSLAEVLRPSLMISIPFGSQYCVKLGDNFDEYFQSLSKSVKKSFRLKRNRMEKIADLSLISLDVDNKAKESLEVIERLHAIRQEYKKETSAFSNPQFKRFHLSLLRRFKGTNKAQIRALKHGNNTIACALNYVSESSENPSIYSYLTGFKSANDKRFSPMFVFDILDFEFSTKQGYKKYDLLSAGGTVSYKSSYNSATQAVSRIYWFSLSPQGIGIYVYIKVRCLLSKIKQALKAAIN